MSTISIADASRQFSQIINRAAYGREIVVLTSRGQPKAVLLGVDAFDRLVGMDMYAKQPLVPLDDLQQKFRTALEEAGYHTREQLIDLVQDVKRELAAEGNLLSASS